MTDPAAPEGLRPLAQPDARFPVFHASVAPRLQVMSEYFAAIAARDLADVADLVHFPFATFAGTEPVKVESRAARPAHPPN